MSEERNKFKYIAALFLAHRFLGEKSKKQLSVVKIDLENKKRRANFFGDSAISPLVFTFLRVGKANNTRSAT
jgi:hypothetical protein